MTLSRERRVALDDTIRPYSELPAARDRPRRPKLLFLVTEDWYFCSHRLPVARAARDGGFEVVVATRVRAHGGPIADEGFALRPLPWRRRGDGLAGAARAIAAITRLYQVERPDILHHVALKPVLFGGLARSLAFGRAGTAPAVINSVMGLGAGFSAGGLGARLRRPALGAALRLAAARNGSRVIVQNPEDGAALAAFGIDRRQIALVRGSGVDLRHFAPLPPPEGGTVAVALVSRMLRDKGVLDAVAAIRLLRARGVPVELLLAGPTDPDNPGSLSAQSLAALAAEPGVSVARQSDRRARGVAACGDCGAAFDLWRGYSQGIARSGRLRPPDRRQRRAGLPRGGADRDQRERHPGAAARCRSTGRRGRGARRRPGAARGDGTQRPGIGGAALWRGGRRARDPGPLPRRAGRAGSAAMTRAWTAAAALGGFLSVTAGALAAHGGGARAAELLRTGALYGLVHAAALLALVAIAGRSDRPGLMLAIAGWSFVAGIFLFSCSLFALALTGLAGFAAVTPFGGTALLIGWAALGFHAARRR